MSAPTVDGLVKLKRLARYLMEAPEVEICVDSRIADETLVHVCADSDWAGCTRTRKSTSGGVMVFGGGVVTSWASTQASVDLSVR